MSFLPVNSPTSITQEMINLAETVTEEEEPSQTSYDLKPFGYASASDDDYPAVMGVQPQEKKANPQKKTPAKIDFDADFVSLAPERQQYSFAESRESSSLETLFYGEPVITISQMASINEREFDQQRKVIKRQQRIQNVVPLWMS